MPEEQSTEDEISLIDLFAVLWHRKVMIITITIIAAIGVVVFAVISIILPPVRFFMLTRERPSNAPASIIVTPWNRLRVISCSTQYSSEKETNLLNMFFGSAKYSSGKKIILSFSRHRQYMSINSSVYLS
ncbi:hypothetical protein FACS189450_09590 [Spirochaetia bacterium]|nr:hypothetical protein FACS189450_09590 [Spirochaetia bacterium]